MDIFVFLEGTGGFLLGLGTFFLGIAALLPYITVLLSHIRSRQTDTKRERLLEPIRYRRLLLGIFSLAISVGIILLQYQGQPLNVQLTSQAWNDFNRGDYESAIAYAEKCINEFQGSADREQLQLEKDRTPLPPKEEFSDQEKKTILARGLLNDVATCFYIKGRSAENLERKDEARQAYQAASKYTYARTWDPKGWFWSPSEVASDRLNQLQSLTTTPASSPTEAPMTTSAYTPIITQIPTVTITQTVSFTPINVTDAFFPSGFMGDTNDIILDESSTENPYSKPTSIKITYSATGSQGEGWAGIYWQYPGKNWGDKSEFRDLTGATKLTFWVRGNRGGEKAEFKVGGITGKYPDSIQPAISTGVVTLSDKWQQYTIDLSGKDLSHVIGGFVWVTNKNQNPQGSVIYLDDMRYE